MVNGLKAKTIKKRTIGFLKLYRYLNSLGFKKKIKILNILKLATKSDSQLRKIKIYTIAMAFERGQEQGIETLTLEVKDCLSLIKSL